MSWDAFENALIASPAMIEITAMTTSNSTILKAALFESEVLGSFMLGGGRRMGCGVSRGDATAGVSSVRYPRDEERNNNGSKKDFP